MNPCHEFFTRDQLSQAIVFTGAEKNKFTKNWLCILNSVLKKSSSKKHTERLASWPSLSSNWPSLK